MDETRAVRAAVRPVWYAGGATIWGELWTMLHLPYTGMVLCFVVLGAVFSPTVSWSLLAIMLTLYFVGLGIGSHFLDQISGMGSKYSQSWSNRSLWAGGLAAIVGATAIGLWGSYYFLGPAVTALVGLQAFFAVAYPLAPVFRGWFHGDGVFAFSWATLPFLVSFVAQSGTITLLALLTAGVLGAVGLLEIRLSRRARADRQRMRSAQPDEQRSETVRPAPFWVSERRIKWLVGATYAATVIAVLVRVIGGSAGT